jgi:hypothetical protein
MKAIYAFLTRLAPSEAQMIERPRESGPSGGFALPPGYDGIAEAKQLLRSIRSGALATLATTGGFPFASLTTVATDHDGAPILLMADAQTTGGYPKIAAVIRADIARLAQLEAGTAIRFEAISTEEATARLRRHLAG